MNKLSGFLVQVALGLVFGIGLVVSGMSNPQKVLNFLDVLAIPSGGWDPSLAFVMGGAVLVAGVGFRWVLGKPRPLFEDSFRLPERQSLDAPLLMGAATFGLGWGIAGFCPGPALTAVTNPSGKGLVFCVAMLIGMTLARLGTAAIRSNKSSNDTAYV